MKTTTVVTNTMNIQYSKSGWVTFKPTTAALDQALAQHVYGAAHELGIANIQESGKWVTSFSVPGESINYLKLNLPATKYWSKNLTGDEKLEEVLALAGLMLAAEEAIT